MSLSLDSNELFKNFSQELSRRIYNEEEGSEYESEFVDMHQFITSPDYMDLSQDISEANSLN